MYLIDTMVLSERSKAQANPAVISWLDSVRFDDGYISVITIGEVQRGIRKFGVGEKDRADRHLLWLENTLLAYGKRVLPVTTALHAAGAV